MHEHATLEQLLVLANIGSLNAEFIHMDLPQDDQLKQLNDIATRHPPDENAHCDRLAF